MWQSNESYRYKNIALSDNNYFNSLFVLLESLTLLLLLNYYKHILQRLGSSVHLVLCDTKNKVVKSKSLATLNPTSEYCVKVSRSDITYCWKIIHCQELIFRSTYHMLIAHLP
jgi:hypothetical protein